MSGAAASCGAGVHERAARFAAANSDEETDGQWLPVYKSHALPCADRATTAVAAEAEAPQPERPQPAAAATAAASGKQKPWLPVFQGFVQYEQVLRSQRRRVRPGMAPSGPHLIAMRGPGGHGRAEAALTIRCPSAPAAAEAPPKPALSRLAASLSAALLPGAWEDECKAARPVFECSLISLQVAVADAMRCLLDLPVGAV